MADISRKKPVLKNRVDPPNRSSHRRTGLRTTGLRPGGRTLVLLFDPASDMVGFQVTHPELVPNTMPKGTELSGVPLVRPLGAVVLVPLQETADEGPYGGAVRPDLLTGGHDLVILLPCLSLAFGRLGRLAAATRSGHPRYSPAWAASMEGNGRLSSPQPLGNSHIRHQVLFWKSVQKQRPEKPTDGSPVTKQNPEPFHPTRAPTVRVELVNKAVACHNS